MQGFLYVFYKILTLYIRQKRPKSLSNLEFLFIQQALIMNFIFSILVLLLEGMIIHTIIKLEYEVNAIEHALKKVFGYSLFQKNRKMILITFVTSLLSIITAATCAIVLNLGSIGYMIVGGIIILILELLLISFNIRRVENAKIQTILKGGNI